MVESRKLEGLLEIKGPEAFAHRRVGCLMGEVKQMAELK